MGQRLSIDRILLRRQRAPMLLCACAWSAIALASAGLSTAGWAASGVPALHLPPALSSGVRANALELHNLRTRSGETARRADQPRPIFATRLPPAPGGSVDQGSFDVAAAARAALANRVLLGTLPHGTGAPAGTTVDALLGLNIMPAAQEAHVEQGAVVLSAGSTQATSGAESGHGPPPGAGPSIRVCSTWRPRRARSWITASN